MNKIYFILVATLTLNCSTKKNEDISFEGVKNFDFSETASIAKKENKTILIYFSAITCMNCRRMEKEILSDSEIKAAILQNNIFVPLVVDDETVAEKKYWKRSMFSNAIIKKIGEINSEFQIQLTQSGSQPYFAIISCNKKVRSSISHTKDKDEFLNFLKSQVRQEN